MAFGVLCQQLTGGVEMGVLANAGKDIEDLAPGGRGVLHSIGGEEREPVMTRQIQAWLVGAIFSAKTMPLNFYKNIFTTKGVD
jgi:hypothetical protein